MRLPVLPCLAAALFAVLPVQAQITRRERLDPELVIESGGRTGACDYLTFTKDGKQLLAVGDDKVVRIWDFVDGTLRPAERPVLRWNIWHEQRGAIYCVALSPNDDNKYVAIGGLGERTTTVSVLERATGEVVHTLAPLIAKKNFGAVWAIDFAPSGKKVAFGASDGSVFVWDFKTFAVCGQHQPAKIGDSNQLRLVRFLNEDTVLSIAEDGSMQRWAVGGDTVRGTPMTSFAENTTQTFRYAELSPDRKWLAVARNGSPGTSATVLLRSVDGTQHFQVPLADGEFPRAVRFDPKDNSRLVASVGALVRKTGGFYIEADHELRIYDLSGRAPKLSQTLRHSYRAEALALHPTKNYLAVGGGDNHEVTLWNLDKTDKPAAVMQGAGSCLWGVALSDDGNQIALQDHRDKASADPNRRGTGDWRVFDLPKRQWREAGDFVPVQQLSKTDGWSVKPDEIDPYVWYAVHDSKRLRFELPRFPKQEGMPRCFTFIKREGKTPTRLAVGHYWGLSLYELTDAGAKRTRVFAGHQGEVTSLACSADKSWIVSVSNDQTVAAWNIGDTFPSHPMLGAKFALEPFGKERERLMVKKVDVGSPAWEAGLVENDEVVLLAFNADYIEGGKAAWLKRLENPEPGRELYFMLRRGGTPLKAADRARCGMMGGCAADWIEGFTVPTLTTVRHRPLWRFFPTREGEWALWMWRNSFYDTSTKGDSSIGWLVNGVESTSRPTFYKAEQFRKVLERSDVLDKLLKNRDVSEALREVSANPLPLQFDRFEPAAPSLTLSATTVGDKPITVTVFATAVGINPDHQPERAELWVNDFRLVEWNNLAGWVHEGKQYRSEVVIPNKNLRAGDNIVTFQTYNRLGGRADIAAKITCTRELKKGHLYGLVVGVDDYSAIKGAGGTRGNLSNLRGASNDAKEFRDLWRQSPLYEGKPDVLERLEATANRDDIIKALEQLADKVGPDDTCVLLMAGHGLFWRVKGQKDEPDRTTFVFCCHDIDLAKPVESGITNELLYAKLARIQGHKVVIVDACHSGEAAINPVRSLTPGGQGPAILAACDRNQSSFEFPKDNPRRPRVALAFGAAAAAKVLGNTEYPRHGLFTYAILQALGEKSAEAANAKGELDAAAIFNYTRKRMPSLLEQIDVPDDRQTPIWFPPKQGTVPLARLKEK